MKLTSTFTFLAVTIITVHCINAHPAFEPSSFEKRQDSASNVKGIIDMIINKYSNIKSSARNTDEHQQVQQFPEVDTGKKGKKQVGSIQLTRDVQVSIYYSTLTIGNQNFKFLLDTGSSNFWIPNKNCTGSCDKSKKFDPRKSKTFKPEGKPWSIAYGAGTAQGVTGIDNIKIAGITGKKQIFGLTDDFEDSLNDVWDGILGLGFDNLNTIDKGAPTPITTLAKQGKIDPIFSFQFSQDDNNGTFTLGGTDEKAFKGDINFKPVTDEDGFWGIQLDDTIVNGKSLSLGSHTIFDTGSPFNFISPKDAAVIFNKIKGAVINPDGTVTIPCDSKDSLSFKFNDEVYKIDLILSKDGDNCISTIMVGDIGGGWLFGHPFLKEVYSVFDMGKRQLGFATLR